MEKDIDCLVTLVRDDGRSVISICGMGGLGKTTVARKVYNHPDVQRSFRSRAWICVTQEFQGENVLREILKQLDQSQKVELNNMTQRQLVVQLHALLVQKKSLVVIDDIWRSEDWEILQPAFPSTCKVLLTTRTENIVPRECVYKLGVLTEDQGWELLQKIAFPRNIDTPALESEIRSVEAIGRQIVEKCGRLPLAISVIGGLLREKQILPEWKEVHNNIDSYLKHGEGIGNDTRVKQVLDLSYDALPYYLKPCFLYLGSFPEDEEIEVGRLYYLWMAEGLISSQEKGNQETLRDVAQRYLTELAFRCMVQVRKNEVSTVTDKFCSWCLHDLMRDLCTSKAEEERFLKRIERPRDLPPIGTPLSRVSISLDENFASLEGIQGFEGLRSFLVVKKDVLPVSLSFAFENDTIDFEKSRHLRILLLENCEFGGGVLPSGIGKLIHLRFFSLSDSKLEELPSFICNLPYLQTLDLRMDNPVKLPNLICKMKRLRHLHLKEIHVIGGNRLTLDGLKELETLDCEDPKMICFADIPKLTNLRHLSIVIKDIDSLSIVVLHISNNQCQLRSTDLRVLDCDFSSNEGKDVFEKLLMSHSLSGLRVKGCNIACGLPSYRQGMSEGLVSLELYRCTVGGDAMEIAGKYPVLKYLQLREVLLERKMIFYRNSFPELKGLNLSYMPNLKEWDVEESAMPNLSQLIIHGCNGMEMIPDGFRFLSRLQALISYMPRKFNDRLRVVNGQVGEDYPKVCHIPLFEFYDRWEGSGSSEGGADYVSS